MGTPSGRAPPRLGGGRFHIVDQIGDGGTATVYLAWDAANQDWCALKALQFRHLQDPEMRRRFAQEAEALEILQHPNVPRLIAHEPDATPPFMAMELARCGSTMDWVREHGPMPQAMAVDVVFQVCEALSVVHARGMIHRDVKPHNVLLDDLGVCKLTDFGIARVPENTGLTETGSQIGTFSFMAPEQRTDTKSVDHRADIYSVGASLFTLLTGRTSAELFVADTTEEMLEDVPAAFRDLIRRATRYRPDDRYASITDLQADLTRVLSRLSPTAADTPPLVRPPQPLPVRPPEVIPAQRRFPDLERSLALDMSQPTFVSTDERAIDTEPFHPRRVMPYFMPERSPARPERGRSDALPAYLDPAERKKTTQPPPPPRPSPPPEPQSSRVSSLLLWIELGLLGMFGIGAVAIATALMILGAGIWQVNGARNQAGLAADALTSTLQVDGNVVYDLAGDRSTFETIYQQYLDAPSEEARLQAALAFVEAIDHTVASGGAPSTSPKVRRLRESRDAYLQRRATWSQQAQKFPGGLAVGVGLARAP